MELLTNNEITKYCFLDVTEEIGHLKEKQLSSRRNVVENKKRKRKWVGTEEGANILLLIKLVNWFFCLSDLWILISVIMMNVLKLLEIY